MSFFLLRGFWSILINFLGVCGGTLLLFVEQSLIHSHNFFYVLGESVSVGRCAFFVFGEQQAAE